MLSRWQYGVNLGRANHPGAAVGLESEGKLVIGIVNQYWYMYTRMNGRTQTPTDIHNVMCFTDFNGSTVAIPLIVVISFILCRELKPETLALLQI